MILDLYLTHNEFKYPRVNKDLLIIFFFQNLKKQLNIIYKLYCSSKVKNFLAKERKPKNKKF